MNGWCAHGCMIIINVMLGYVWQKPIYLILLVTFMSASAPTAASTVHTLPPISHSVSTRQSSISNNQSAPDCQNIEIYLDSGQPNLHSEKDYSALRQMFGGRLISVIYCSRAYLDL